MGLSLTEYVRNRKAVRRCVTCRLPKDILSEIDRLLRAREASYEVVATGLRETSDGKIRISPSAIGTHARRCLSARPAK